MEIYPERFLQATGKAVRSSSFKRGNKTALKLIEMSKGNIDSESQNILDTPDNASALDTPDNASAQKESIEEDDLMKELDTEGVLPENDQELVYLLMYNKEKGHR